MSVSTKKKLIVDTYFKLVHRFPLRRLKSASEHAAASKIYLQLSSGQSDQGTRDYLDVLADLIVEYEKRADDTIDAAHLSAADLVHHRLDERGMSVSALAREIGIPQSNLSQMLAGRRDWSKAAIRQISKLYLISPARFLS